MSATEQDQKQAVALLRAAAADGLIQDTEPRHQPAMVERIAAALAEERGRARAPFLALAAQWEGKGESKWQGWRRALAHDYDSYLYAKALRRAAGEGE